jgi:hypothetical protein
MTIHFHVITQEQQYALVLAYLVGYVLWTAFLRRWVG